MNQRKTSVMEKKRETSEEGGATAKSDSLSKNKQTEQQNNSYNSKNKQAR